MTIKPLDTATLDALAAAAAASSRQRANHNLHPDLADPVQRLAIAMQPGTYVRPHRHPHTWELLTPLRGRFLVLHFSPDGLVTNRTVLGEDCAVLETPAGGWHAVLSLDEGGIIFEVKLGPYAALGEGDLAPWSAPAESADVAATLAWYERAAVGDRWQG